MAVFRIVDDKVLSETDYLANAQSIARHFELRARTAEGIAPLTLSAGVQLAAMPPPAGSAIEFTPIGPGLPLQVAIRHVYTGKFPERNFFGHRGDMAIVSGVKNFSAFNATARAVNFVETAVSPQSHFLAPTAFNDGTPIILYSPAVIDPAVTISIEMAVADGFSQTLLDDLSSAFQSLAGIPILLPAAGYLLGAGSVLKMAEGVASDLYQSSPAFLRTEVLNFSLPGAPQAHADWRLICNPSLPAGNYTYRDGVGLIDSANAPYTGDEPYIVLSLDGRANDDLKGFTPAIASSTVMQKFFQIKDGAEAAISTFVSAVGLYSDLKFRQQADQLQQQINQETDPVKKADLQSQHDAIVKNITESLLIPK